MLSLTNENIIEKVKRTKSDPVYQKLEPMLEVLLPKLPGNTECDEIAAKILLIDKLYSTQLLQRRKMSFLYDIVENIRTIPNFDSRVKEGDPTLVPAIYHGLTYNGEPVRLFSFATKYCCLHNTLVYGRDDYSIFDSRVAKMLPKYARASGVALTGAQLYRWKDAGDYASFNKIVAQVLDAAGITLENRRRVFDLFLWGKEDEE